MKKSPINPLARKRKGQALVEFSLTLLIFMLLLFMIVEVARIMQVYLTLQHAAKQGARYAVTGDFFANYATDPLSGWDLTGTSNDALDYISPCWPRFYDDMVDPTFASINYYEPYRDARTCSIEEMTVRGLTGLPLDPHALPSDGGFYQVVVRGVGDAVTPDTSITRYITEPTHIMYGIYPADPVINTELTTYGYDYSHEDEMILYPGFGGKPNQNVVVQVEYRMRINTPILRNIAPTIRLVGQAKMTNESFGSTGTMRGSVLPPSLPPIPTLGLPIPPDLKINSFSTTTTGTINPGTPMAFNITITNIGGLDAISAGGYNVRVFAYDPNEALGETPLTATQLAAISRGATAAPGVELNGVSNVFTASLLAGSALATSFDMEIPATAPSGVYYLYAFVDGANVFNESGNPADSNYDLGREENNMFAAAGTVVVGAEVDLEIQSFVPSTVTPNQGGTMTVTVTGFNRGPNPTQDAYIQLIADGANITNAFSLDASSNPSCTTGPNYFTCDLDALLNGGSETATFVLNVTGAVGNIYEIYAFIDFADDAIEKAVNRTDNESTHVDIAIGAVDLKMDIAVDNIQPMLNDTLNYTVTITNDSENPANNVVVRVNNNVAGNLQFLTTPAPVLAAGTITSITDNEIIWNIPTLPANTSYTLAFDALVISDNGDVVTTAAITSTHLDATASDNTDSVTISMFTADLRITKVITSPTIGMVSEFQTVTYHVTVSNSSSSDIAAAAVVVTDTLPGGLVYNPASPPTVTRGSVVYDTATRTYTWSGFNLAIGSNAIMTYTVAVEDDAHITYGSALNVAEVTSNTSDDNLANNIDNDTSINFVLLADLKLEATLSRTTAQAGQAVTYTLTATNKSTSPSPATNVRVTGILTGSAANAFASVTPSGTVTGTFNPVTGTWNIGTMQPGDVVTLTLVAVSKNTMATNPTTASATMTITSDTPEIAPADNTATVSTKFYDFGIFINNGSPGTSCDLITEWGWDMEYGFNWNRDNSTSTIRGVTVYRWDSTATGKDSLAFVAPPGFRAPNQDLARCYREDDVGYAFENLPAGRYQIVLMVAKPDTRDRRLNAYYRTDAMANFSQWLSNFDVPTQVYGIAESASISVQAGGDIYVYIQQTGARAFYLRGIGIYMISDTP